VRGLIKADGPCGRLVFDYANRYRLVISQPVLIEILEVMTRSSITRTYRGLATRNIQVILGILASADESTLQVFPPSVAIGRTTRSSLRRLPVRLPIS
jgi:hypothetical protein